jgi:3-oxo-5,6-didehydrosuberyl-CoA/3-oxoadipyl-CoA thiolase
MNIRARPPEQLAALKTPFRKNGVVTGNASGVNDGAAALIIASEQMALAQGLVPRTRIVAMATAGVEPRLMGLGPVPATRKVLERAGLILTIWMSLSLTKLCFAGAGRVASAGLTG